MVGIINFGAYIPKYRLGADTIGWHSNQERSVANFDEDTVTMAVAAGYECIKGFDRGQIDGLIFASTTPPYSEKQCAAIVAEALDLNENLFTSDVTDVLKCGTTALRSAFDAISAGSCGLMLVIISDSRQGPPRSETERNSGDGAVGFLLGSHNVIAEYEGFYSVTKNLLDNWRSNGDPFVRTWEDRFAIEEGLENVLNDATSAYLLKYNMKPSDFARVALYAPDGRRHTSLAKGMGFDDNQIEPPLFGFLGNIGAAFAPMLLAKALESRVEGERLLVASYGDGSDILGFKMTQDTKLSRDLLGVTGYLESKEILESYETYAKWRSVWDVDDGSRRPDPQSPSAIALWRESDKNIKLYGSKCNSCGYIQYPMQSICVNCQSRDDYLSVRFSDQQGNIFTYSMDYIAGSVDVPLVITVVNFDDGGRILCMMTDREIGKVHIGMRVQMSFRKLRVVNGIHNYYWKSIPIRGVANAGN
ncbi:MAG: 3-hydroxy-3-methylglutaryl CoA synthase [Dehalococcoidia bacterium]|nr:3-hydroxy-3-methylglutaryl CoA synthase [Dehalococcoidia bacterium]